MSKRGPGRAAGLPGRHTRFGKRNAAMLRTAYHEIIERLWRSLKYECVYLNAFDNMKDAKEKLKTWIEYYNHERPHSSLNDQTPNEVYEGIEPLSLAA